MPNEVKEAVEKFLPVFCPICERLIGEIQSGVSRYYCSHCKRKARAKLVLSERVPIGVIYLLIEQEIAEAKRVNVI
ncbi:MAG TPA: hypothetical protein VJ302_23325 [Blastocatellia bacterium]|nr:hypothetical protein [Blastocatellia bacterium]